MKDFISRTTDPRGSSSRSVSTLKDKTGFFWNNPVAILYRDAEVIVFDKPAGVLTIANPKEPDKNLTALVNYQLCRHPEERSDEGSEIPRPSGLRDDSSRRKNKKLGAKIQLFPCHRLDRETSGAIIFAKSLEIQHRMMDMFKSREIVKKYIACVQGHLNQKSGDIRSEIIEDGKAKPATSHYRVLEKKDLFSVVEVQPMTGRTNQIRIQFSQMGHPLVGDRKFCISKDFAVKFKRTALHASYVQWKSPFTRKMIQVEADLPEDMQKLINATKGGVNV